MTVSEAGAIGGKKGGKMSLYTMTAEERKKRAQAAAAARWKKKLRPPEGNDGNH